MPVYGTKPAPALYPGDQYILSNASQGTAQLTQSVAVYQDQSGAPANLTIINGSTATLTVEVAATDLKASYQPFSGLTVAANSALAFSSTAPFVAVLPSSDPSTGVITICR